LKKVDYYTSNIKLLELIEKGVVSMKDFEYEKYFRLEIII